MGRTSATRGVWRIVRASILGGLTVASISITGDAVRGQSPAPSAVAPDHPQRMRASLELYRQQVRPILVQHCARCHSGDEPKGDVDLNTRESLLKSGHVGQSAEASHLMEVIRHTAEPHMPHRAAKLADEQIAAIAQWIDLGAAYDGPLVGADSENTSHSAASAVTDAQRQFWSFQRLADVEPPTLDSLDPAAAAWCRNPVDQFVRLAQQQHGLTPNQPIDRARLIRRVYFDLLGLPPTPAEIDKFVNDKHPQAYERLLDRLLDSPHYGERWARHWMDVARFGESCGFEHDDDRRFAYHYRDFLIRAFQTDLPYDQFVQWQIAGDELAPDEPQAWMATGFLSAGVFPTQITESEFERVRYDELDDMVSTTGVAFLGLSVGCARCHDHKFDPIPSLDYYRLTANFATTIRSEIDLTLNPAAEPTKVQVASENVPHVFNHADGRGYPHFYEQVFHLKRGDANQKGEAVSPGFLQVLTAPGHESSDEWRQPPPDWTRTRYQRAALAQWMTDPEHGAGHLAARVMVNRLWQHHFGRGIVGTPNDFGLQGDRPSHPELLDWLARQLIKGGWRLKPLHKLIMTSSTYLQDTTADPARLEVDPQNRFLWRQSPRRLDGEVIRDSMLAVSGLLDRTPFGPGSLDPAMQRRSVYFFVKRSQLAPSMMLFDWPEHLVSQGERSSTTTAPQALFFMNSPQARRCADALATRAMQGVNQQGVKEDQPEFVEKWFTAVVQLALGRPARDDEVSAARNFLQRQTEIHRMTQPDQAAQLARVDLCQTVLSMNEFSFQP
ncbi:MAG: DUF1553 domain-containing protein [Pirellulales bacterium]